MMRAAHVAELGKPPDGRGRRRRAGRGPRGRSEPSRPRRRLGPLPARPSAAAVRPRQRGRRASRRGTHLPLRRGLRGTGSDGFLAERVDFPAESAIPVPSELDDAAAAACGIAGSRRLGTRGAACPGASPTTACSSSARPARSDRWRCRRRAPRSGADRRRGTRCATSSNECSSSAPTRSCPLDGDGLAERFREACGGDGPTLVVDPLWGEPSRAAVDAAAPRARDRPAGTVGRTGGDAHVGLDTAEGPLDPRPLELRAFAPRSFGRRTSRSPGTSRREGSRSTSRRFRSTRSARPGALRRPAGRLSSCSRRGEIYVAPTAQGSRSRGASR